MIDGTIIPDGGTFRPRRKYRFPDFCEKNFPAPRGAGSGGRYPVVPGSWSSVRLGMMNFLPVTAMASRVLLE